MQSVVAHVQENDVLNPTIILLEERNRQKNINPNAKWYERSLNTIATTKGSDKLGREWARVQQVGSTCAVSHV